MNIALPGTREQRLLALNSSDSECLQNYVELISASRIEQGVRAFPGPRSRLFHPEAMQAADKIILKAFEEAGWQVETRSYTLLNQDGVLGHGTGGATHYDRLDGSNIVATLPGELSDEAIVVMAHHDTVSESPGANDNTASVVCMLEMARALARKQVRHTLVFAAVDMEEIGFLGSKVFTAEIQPRYRIRAVINFETMAYTSVEPGSQNIPAGFEYLYPQQVQRLRSTQMRGDTTVILYNGISIPLTITFASALAHLVGKERIMMLRDPNNLPLIGKFLGRKIPLVRQFARSDHLHFWQAGIPAIMITDTANFRYTHYHKMTDTPDRLDYIRLAQISAASAFTVIHGWG